MPMVVGLDLSRARAVINSAIANPQLTIQHRHTDIAPPGRAFTQQPVNSSSWLVGDATKQPLGDERQKGYSI